MTTTFSARPHFDPRVPFSRADARAAGIAEKALRTPAYQRIFHDTYLCSSVRVTTAVRAAAAIQRAGSSTAYVSHHTAAELWGIPAPVDGLTHITAAKDEGRNRCRGVITHKPLARGDNVRDHGGLRVSAPEQVFCELATAGIGLVDLVVAGDAMLKTKRATIESLKRAVRGMRGRGVRTARRALGYVRAGVDSPMESRLRMLPPARWRPEWRQHFPGHVGPTR